MKKTISTFERSPHAFSCEMTFIPSIYPHEILDKTAGQKICGHLNKMLTKLAKSTNLNLFAKLDPLHDKRTPGLHQNTKGGHETYCIEIVPLPGFPLYTHWLEKKEWETTQIVIDGLFRILEPMGLVPMVVETTNGVERHWPTGGCHIHYSSDLFELGPDWYKLMERFHRNLLIDYANRPYIRWLFCQWFNDKSCLCLIDQETLQLTELSGVKKLTEKSVWNYAFWGNHSIEPRYMLSSKATYSTFEFRFFNMIANASELRSIVRFVNRWVTHHVALATKDKKLPLTINLKEWVRLANLEESRKECRNLLDSLGLDVQDYRIFEERNLENRFRFGNLV
jgi:hypothetical protein